jgi:hypothetical protein
MATFLPRCIVPLPVNFIAAPVALIRSFLYT